MGHQLGVGLGEHVLSGSGSGISRVGGDDGEAARMAIHMAIRKIYGLPTKELHVRSAVHLANEKSERRLRNKRKCED